MPRLDLRSAVGSGAEWQLILPVALAYTRIEGWKAAMEVLENDPGFVPVAEAADGDSAVQLYQRLRPDITLLDLQMPGLDGITATHRILGDNPQARILS